MGGFTVLGSNFETGLGMLLHVVVEHDLVVQRGVDAPCLEQLNGLVEIVNAGIGGAIALGERCVARSQRVRRRLAAEVVHTRDIGVFRGDDHDPIVCVRVGERVLLLALRGHRNTVRHGVVAPRIETRKQAIPFAFCELGIDAQLCSDGARDLDVKAGELSRLVVERPGAPCALGGKRHAPALLYLYEQVVRSGRRAGVADAHRACTITVAAAARKAGERRKGTCTHNNFPAAQGLIMHRANHSVSFPSKSQWFVDTRCLRFTECLRTTYGV